MAGWEETGRNELTRGRDLGVVLPINLCKPLIRKSAFPHGAPRKSGLSSSRSPDPFVRSIDGDLTFPVLPSSRVTGLLLTFTPVFKVAPIITDNLPSATWSRSRSFPGTEAKSGVDGGLNLPRD